MPPTIMMTPRENTLKIENTFCSLVTNATWTPFNVARSTESVCGKKIRKTRCYVMKWI